MSFFLGYHIRNAILWAASGEQWAVSRKLEFFFEKINDMQEIGPITVQIFVVNSQGLSCNLHL